MHADWLWARRATSPVSDSQTSLQHRLDGRVLQLRRQDDCPN